MEAIVAPQGRDHWDKMGMGSALQALRSEAGEQSQKNWQIGRNVSSGRGDSGYDS
jgi:hypothetical protein